MTSNAYQDSWKSIHETSDPARKEKGREVSSNTENIHNIEKYIKDQTGEYCILQRTSWAVNRFLGSLTSIFLTKSFALSDIAGQGSDTKSSSPFTICSNIPCSVSDRKISACIRHHGSLETRCEERKSQNLTIPKWRHTAKKYINNYSSTPDVTFWTITLPQDFWCYIVRASNHIREGFTWMQKILN